ncbi:MAG: hypothetical protein LBI48_11540 [Burkholderiaceae bacterium]|nr:hypothetical protein [Burkholderiaceae bacterium]
MPNKVFKIPDTLGSAYHGCGWALAASAGGQLVALRYINDIAPGQLIDALEEDKGEHAEFFVRQWLQTEESGKAVRELQALGDVHVGMCSCWEFVEL